MGLASDSRMRRLSAPGVVEARQQDERAIPHVAVGVLGHGLKERGDRLSARRPPHRARGIRAGRVVEIAELVDGRLELRGGDRLRRARFLRACSALTVKDTKDTKDTEGKARARPA